MADEPVTLEQVKAQLRLETDETDHDVRLRGLIQTARATAEEYIKRDIVATWPDVTARQRIVAAQAITLLVEEWFLKGADSVVPVSVMWLLNRIRLPRI